MKKLQRGVVVKLLLTEEQQIQCMRNAGCCRWVWNWALALRTEEYKKGNKLHAYDLMSLLPMLKKKTETGWLNEAQASSLQQVLLDQQKAFEKFFKKQTSYPIFRKKGRRDSFRFCAYFSREDKHHLKLPKLGTVKMVGWNPKYDSWTAKSVTVFKRADMWFASILVETEYVQVTHSSPNSMCGIDMGITHFASIYDKVSAYHEDFQQENIRWCEKRIALLQDKLARCVKFSSNFHKWRIKIARLFSKIANIRKDFQHKLSRRLVNQYNWIVLEDLNVRNMTASASGTIEEPGTNVAAKRGLNRSILRQGWGRFHHMLHYKASETGSRIGFVDPRYTSQTCPQCTHCSKENRKSQASFHCVQCGFSENADLVASMNIFSLGTRVFQIS